MEGHKRKGPLVEGAKQAGHGGLNNELGGTQLASKRGELELAVL